MLPWIGPEQLDNNIDLAIRQQAVDLATFVLWSLTGRRLHVEQTREEKYRLQCGAFNWIELRESVKSVASVLAENICTPATISVPSTEYYNSGQRLYLRDAMHTINEHCAGCVERTLSVNYLSADNLPMGTAGVVKKFAEELMLSVTNPGACSLPQRIQTITRSNVSWTMLDPQDFLEAGRTGVGYVDQWIAAANPAKMRQKPRLFHPSAPRMISSRWTV